MLDQVVIKDALPARGGPADTGALRAAAQQLRLSTSTSSFLAPPDTAGQPPRPLRSQTSSDNLSGPPSAQVRANSGSFLLDPLQVSSAA